MGRSNQLNPQSTLTLFSRLVRDDTQLKPQLEDDTLFKDPASVQAAYREMLQSLHDSVAEALEHLTDPLEDGEMHGLYGQASGDTFDLNALAADLSGQVPVETALQPLPDYLIQTVDEDTIPDAHFVAFMETKAFYGLPPIGPDERSLSEVRSEMVRVKDEIAKAEASGNVELSEELRDVFSELRNAFRTGAGTPHTEHSEPKNAERQQDPAAEHYAERRME